MYKCLSTLEMKHFTRLLPAEVICCMFFNLHFWKLGYSLSESLFTGNSPPALPNVSLNTLLNRGDLVQSSSPVFVFLNYTCIFPE